MINAYGTTCLSERNLKIKQNEKIQYAYKMRKNIWCY